MKSTSTYVSLHDRRVRLVANAVRANFELTEQAAFEVATHTAGAFNHIPARVRPPLAVPLQ